MADTDPRVVVERYMRDVLSGGRPDSADGLVGSDGLRKRVDAFRAAFPDLVVTPHLVVSDGEYVGVHASGRGTHRGIFQGVPASGRSWTASFTGLYRVEHGKISDFWINWDLLGILEQLGAIQRPATASA